LSPDPALAGETRGTPLLEMRGVSKTFPGVKALNNVSLKA
jgi:ABC-type sugar transport system ATPase subunit